MGVIKKEREDFDLMTSENEQYFVRLIFFKRFKTDSRWHIALPELAEVRGEAVYFRTFCDTLLLSEIDTQDRQRLFRMMDSERSAFCDKCAEEFCIAEPALKALGYLQWEKK